MSETPGLKRAAGVYIVDKTRQNVLLAQRGPEARNEPGIWEGAGGEVEPGETFNQGALREVREEIGVHVILLRTLSEHEAVVDTNGVNWHTKRFIGSISGTPTIQDPRKVQAIDWFSAGELENIEIASYLRPDIPLLQQYLSVEHLTG